MPMQFVYKAAQSPFKLLAVCFSLWLATHSFFAGLFMFAVVVFSIKKLVKARLSTENQTDDRKAAAPAVPIAPVKVAEEAAQPVTPIKRQYAKSAVVVPLKTGTDN
jgi:hypothetical protein